MNSKYHIFRQDDKAIIFNTLSLKKYFLKITDLQHFKIIESDTNSNSLAQHKPMKDLDNIQIAVTTKCNLRCIYCQLFKNRPKYYSHMALETAKSIYTENEEIFTNGTVIITGGEPTLNWDITKYFIERSLKRKIIFTNGILLDRDKINFLMKNNVFIIVSSDGNMEQNRFSRKSTTNSDQSLYIHQSLLLLRECNAHFGVSLVLNEGNYKNLSLNCKWLVQEYNPVSIGVNIPHYTLDYYWNFPEEELIVEFENLLDLSLSENLFIDPISRYLSPLVKEEFKLHDCSSCGSKIVYYPDGNSSNCILQHLFSGGNNTDIWNSRSTSDSSECLSCFAKGICGGGCIFDGNMFFGEGSFDRRRCSIIRNLTEKILWDMYSKSKCYSPSTDQLHKLYAGLINNPTNNVWSIGHDTTK